MKFKTFLEYSGFECVLPGPMPVAFHSLRVSMKIYERFCSTEVVRLVMGYPILLERSGNIWKANN